MTTDRVTLDGGWTCFQGVNGDDAAVHTATTDLISMVRRAVSRAPLTFGGSASNIRRGVTDPAQR
jgi:hypothetical protein